MMDLSAMTCALCDWAMPGIADPEGALHPNAADVFSEICVLHVVLRHPREYMEATGRNAEAAAAEYRPRLHPQAIHAASLGSAQEVVDYLLSVNAITPREGHDG